jgi:tetraacyldisaccharide 4'-kinase
MLREPVSSIRRASVVALTKADLVSPEERSLIRARVESKVKRIGWVETRHAAIGLIDGDGGSHPLSEIQGRRIAAFCGIGNPEGFERTINGIPGTDLVAFRSFADHHNYSASDVRNLVKWASHSGADLALTTQKDSVKLRTPSLGSVPLRALRISLEIVSGAELLEQALAKLLPARD